MLGYPPVIYTEPASQKYAATLASADVSGNLPAQVKEQANIDFGALQKASLNAATPSVTVSDKTGFSLAVTPPTVSQIDTQLSGTHGSGVWGTGVGSSSLDVTVTSSGEPIEGIMVEVYTSSAKTGFVRKTTTDGAGLAHFDVAAGTYYVWVLHSDYTGTNPTTVTVT